MRLGERYCLYYEISSRPPLAGLRMTNNKSVIQMCPALQMADGAREVGCRPVPRQHALRHDAGGGKLFLGSEGRVLGPGHFGRLDLGDGVQKCSCHREADLDRGGASVIDIRPLLCKDGWPAAGD